MPSQASLVLAADDSRRLAAFYGALLGCPPEAGFSARHWRLPWPGGGLLEIYEPSQSRPLPRQIGRLSLCLQRESPDNQPQELLENWIDALLAAGARLEQAPRQEPFGAEAWLLDPEGNRLLLLVR